MVKQPDARPAQLVSNERSAAVRAGRTWNLEVAPLLSKYYLVVLVVGLLAGLAGWATVLVLPKDYSSAVYLRLDEPTARIANALMQSTPVLDAVSAKLNPPAGTAEWRRRWLDKRRVLSVAPGDSATGAHLFRQVVTDTDPVRAKAINTAFVDAWLNAAQPAPAHKAFVESEIARLEQQLKLIDKYLQQLDKPASGTPTTTPPQSEPRLPTIIAVPADASNGAATLLAKREEATAALARYRQDLLGVTRDVVLSEPSLPEEPSWPRPEMVTALAVAGAEIVLLILIVIREAGWIRWRR